MSHKQYSSITLQNIEFFITVAKTCNMRKSATLLNVTQPLLSQRIAQMENELEIKLFLRQKQGLTLTPAGRAFYESCPTILSKLYAAIDQAQTIHANRTSHITVGLYDALSDAMQYKISRAIQTTFADLLLDFRLIPLCSGREWLQTNDVDILFFPDYEQMQNDPEFETQLVAERPICATLSVDHPLAKKPSLVWKDFVGVDILLQKDLALSGYAKSIRANCLNNGFDPSLVPFDNTNTLRLYMGLGRGVGLAMTRLMDRSEVLTNRIVTDSSFSLILVWKKDSVYQDLAGFASKISPIIAKAFEQEA